MKNTQNKGNLVVNTITKSEGIMVWEQRNRDGKAICYVRSLMSMNKLTRWENYLVLDVPFFNRGF